MGMCCDHRAHAASRYLKVLLPPSLASSRKLLRIPDKLARQFVVDGDAGDGGTTLVFSPLRSKAWRVEVVSDGDGAFLGRGWSEFVAAHGMVGGGLWFVVFRHEGRGVLTVKAFDASCCLREFSRPINADRSEDTPGEYRRRPQFIAFLLRGSTEKMVIPPNFVQNHITEAEMSSRPDALLNLYGKFFCVELEKDRSGKMFFSGVRWSRFLTSSGITEGEALLLRYEGNLVFTVKVFGLDGCQKSFFKSQKEPASIQGIIERAGQTRMKMTELDAPSSSTGKRKRSNEGDRTSVAGTKMPATTSATLSNKKPAAANGNSSTFDIGPPSWFKKEINA